MEHRWNARRPLRVDVALYRPGEQVVLCRSRDLSLEGMRLEVDANALELHVGMAVEVVISLRGGASERPPKLFRTSAVVMHRDEAGIGLMLTTFEPALLCALQALVVGGARAA